MVVTDEFRGRSQTKRYCTFQARRKRNTNQCTWKSSQSILENSYDTQTFIAPLMCIIMVQL